ncbi:hypothetical protein CCACVL1_02351 [Corchorus capsularis]|uniref:HAT C-terminal dimerisation domain-containing protein n=1 Tax=Corchorus capsularis TaxID=210143 RepID=A0A1R3K926_COCAP|nr:hypothetical protein CCACVL1_02351 [Corchorus capsularis]
MGLQSTRLETHLSGTLDELTAHSRGPIRMLLHRLRNNRAISLADVDELRNYTLHPHPEHKDNIVDFEYFDEASRMALEKMIVVDEKPFKIVEHEGFIEFMSILQPKFKMMSRTTVGKDCYKLFLGERKKLKKLFSTLGSRICLTMDIWTSIQNASYLCLTGDNVASNDVVVAHLREKKKERKKSLLLDGEFFHVRCSAHIVNLIVKDGLSVVGPSVTRIRDVQTRWNPTYFMLDSALKFKKAFDRLEDDDIEFSINLDGRAPRADDWSKARVLVNFLKLFYEVTKFLSGTHKYRVLSKLAKDILSTGSRVLDQFHCSLTPVLVESLNCAQDWLRASASPIQVAEDSEGVEKLEIGIIEDVEIKVSTSLE